MESSITIYGSSKSQQVIPTSSIIRITSEVNYSLLFLTNGKQIIISRTLGDFEPMLYGNPNFLRPHKSHIINLNFIESYKLTGSGGTLTLKNGEVFPISRRKGREIKKRIQLQYVRQNRQLIQ